MPANAPDSMTNPDARDAYRNLSRVYEDHCGDDDAKWAEKRASFTEALVAVKEALDAAPAVETP